MKRFAVIAVVLLVLFAGAVVAQARFLSPEPFVIYSEDSQRVFRYEFDRDEWAATISLHESGQELWRVEKFPSGRTRNCFIFSNCLAYFVIVPFGLRPDVLRFYAYGEHVQTYYVDMFMSAEQLRYGQHLSTGYHWAAGSSRDNQANLLTVDAVNGTTFVFDITTGEIVEMSIAADEQSQLGSMAEPALPPNTGSANMAWWAWAAIFGSAAVMGMFLNRVRRKQRTHI